MNDTLFALPSPKTPSLQPEVRREPRLQRPNREQVELRPVDLEGLLPADHRARIVWEFVEGLDLTPLHAEIKAVEGHAGRPPIDPAILMALWLYATVEGVGSARAVARLCDEHDAYRWLCGGVSVNSHTLADFRVQHVAYLDEVLTTSVATLMAEGLVTLTRVAQDGVRVRAHAGAAAFRRGPRLEALLAEAEAQVAALRQEVHDDPAATTRRQAAARRRATDERRQRVAKALEHLPGVAAKQIIVGVDAGNCGSDLGQLAPMVGQLQSRYGQVPAELLVDGGFAKHDDIIAVARPEVGCTVYAPVPTPRDPGRDPYQPCPGDPEAIAQWRQRMGTEAAKTIYKERAATSECVNAIARNRGLQRLLVRGLTKARAVFLWFALAHNLMRGVALRQAARGTA